MKNRLFGLIVLSILIGSGCASTNKTTTTQTTTQYPATSAVGAVADTSTTTVVHSDTETTTTTPVKTEHTGILGGIVHVIGAIIAFPFVVIGGLFRMIF